MAAKDSGGMIRVTKKFKNYPSVLTVVVRGDELDEKALPDAIDAALSLCSPFNSIQGIGYYLYDVLIQAFDVVSVGVEDEPDNTD